MRRLLFPDYDFRKFSDITPEFLKGIGKTCLLCDIDNTLVPYDVPVPSEEVRIWVENMKDKGISLILVSNNDEERVARFNEKLNVPFLFKSGKPSRKTVKKALSVLNCERKDAAMLGDQLLTDIAAARISGITSIWVPSIKKVETPFFRFKSAIERPFIRRYLKNKERTEKKQ